MGTAPIDRDSVRANYHYVDPGYGLPTEGMVKAIKCLARIE